MPAKPNSAAKRARSSPRYATARRQFLADCKRDGRPCALCGDPIDYDLVWDRAKPDPGYPTINHKTPLDHGGDAFDPDNMEPAHHSCNSALGNGVKGTADPSRTWW